MERGLTLTSRALFLIDGSKALRRAIREAFGERVLLQRCELHKLRNALSYPPPEWQDEVRRRLRAAWAMHFHDEARCASSRTLRWLKKINESAAASLAESLEETLTVHRHGVVGTLRRTLVTTNHIESAFDLVRTHARRVKRRRSSAMVLRWIRSGLVRVEQ